MKTINKDYTIIDNWEGKSSKEGSFTEDDIIDAYIKGKKEGREESDRILANHFKQNIEKTVPNTKAVLSYLESIGIENCEARLKINSISEFEIMIIVEEEKFVSSNYRKLYEFVSDLEDEISNENYSIRFTFCTKTIDIDEECIESDGYNLKFRK